jgi:ATP synthase protein I
MGKWADELTLVSQLGLTMAGSILFCFAIGYHLDKWLHTKGLFITLFILLGIAGGGYTVYREIMKTLEQDVKKKTDHVQPK